MSSEHKGKNVFGQDMYQGSDGLYGSKYEADQTYRSDYKKENYHDPFSSRQPPLLNIPLLSKIIPQLHTHPGCLTRKFHMNPEVALLDY